MHITLGGVGEPLETSPEVELAERRSVQKSQAIYSISRQNSRTSSIVMLNIGMSPGSLTVRTFSKLGQLYPNIIFNMNRFDS